jgi:hypothetical protein
MAKSADAADLKSADRKVMGVQVPLRAPKNQDFRKTDLALGMRSSQRAGFGRLFILVVAVA